MGCTTSTPEQSETLNNNNLKNGTPPNATEEIVADETSNIKCINPTTDDRTVTNRTDNGVNGIKETDEQADFDIANIHEASQGFKNVESVLVGVIVPKSPAYQQILRVKYEEKYAEELIRVVKRSTSGSLEYFLVRLLLKEEEFLAASLRDHVEDREFVLIAELLTACTPSTINAAKQLYLSTYDNTFADDLKKSLDDFVTKSLKDVMIPMAALERHGNEIESDEVIETEADSLNQGPDEIAELLVQKPYNKVTLSAIFERYKLKYYLDITDSIDIEFHNDTQEFLTAIVKVSEDSSTYYANELVKAFKDGKEKRIMNILVGRRQVDISTIDKIFGELSNGITLLEAVKKEFNKDCTKAIFTLLNTSCV